MKQMASDITFSPSRTVTIRDEHLIGQFSSDMPGVTISAAVELMERWADPAVPRSALWEIPTHEVPAVLTRMWEAISESRRVTGMLASALAPEPVEVTS